MKKSILWVFVLALLGCSPIKKPLSNEYQLEAFSRQKFAVEPSKQSILVTTPEAVAGYQTGDMRYIQKPYELSSFANNSWVDQPANMLLPLIAQSLEHSGYFKAVASSTSSEQTDYRIDTQLIELQQNFLKKPSVVDLAVKIVLTHSPDNRVIASRLIHERVTCPSDTPYGGVTAANIAVKRFTAKATSFAIAEIRSDLPQK